MHGEYSIHIRVEAPEGSTVWDLILLAVDSEDREVLRHKFDFVNVTEVLSDRGEKHPYRVEFIDLLDKHTLTIGA